MKALNYSDIILVPKHFDAKNQSRRDLDTSVKFGPLKFKVGVVPANMICTMNFDKALQLANNNYFYIMHRFGDQAGFLIRCLGSKIPFISMSIGVQETDKDFVNNLAFETKGKDIPLYLTIDIAHGDSKACVEMVKYVKKTLPNCTLIAGNIGVIDAVYRLMEAGADYVKVGLSMGAACTTYNATGFGTPMFSTLKDLGTFNIIADGGVREEGDIVKSYVAGACMTMVGLLFAACIDSPAENLWQGDMVSIKKPTHKVYFGSASEFTKRSNDSYIEGKKVILPCNGMSYLEFLKKIEERIQSGISYGNCKSIADFCDVEWKRI